MNEDERSQHCPYCDGDMDFGGLITTGSFAAGVMREAGVLYKSSKKKNTQAIIACGACMKCGHMELYINPKQLQGATDKEIIK